MNGLGFAGVERDGVLQSKAELFGVTVGIRATAVFAERYGMLLVAEGTDERVSSGIEAGDLIGSGHIAVDLAIGSGPKRTVVLSENSFLFFIEAALTKAIALRTVCTVNLRFRVGNEVECACGIAVVGERYAPDLASALVRNEDANGTCDIFIGKIDRGEAGSVVTSVIGVTVIERKTEKAPIRAVFSKENISVGKKEDSSAEVVLTKTFAKANLRCERYIFVVEHVIIPMTGRFLFGDDEGFFRKMSVLIHDGSFQRMFYDVIIS